MKIECTIRKKYIFGMFMWLAENHGNININCALEFKVAKQGLVFLTTTDWIMYEINDSH